MKTLPISAAFGFVAPAVHASAVDTAGKPVALADFDGKTFMLAWADPGCAFVQEHCDSANLPPPARR